MFAIGDDKWPGISKLIEECGEVLQVCGKLIATDGAIEHWDGNNLKEWLEKELGDLLAAIAFVTAFCHLDDDAIDARWSVKIEQFTEWHKKAQGKDQS